MRIRHEFVEHIPDQIEDKVLYVSIRFGTVVHNCACGCGQEVVTPLGPEEWRITYDGKTISLAPSIGNWSLPCRSHYWIEGGNVRWARTLSETEVSLGRREARDRRYTYYREASTEATEKDLEAKIGHSPFEQGRLRSKWGIWEKLRWLGRKMR